MLPRTFFLVISLWAALWLVALWLMMPTVLPILKRYVVWIRPLIRRRLGTTMSDELRTTTFQINAKFRIEGTTLENKELLNILNLNKSKVNAQVESEFKTLLPAHVTVQASFDFQEGSIIAIGAIQLLSWTGKIVFAAADEEAKRQLSELVKTGVRRGIEYAVHEIPAFSPLPAQVSIPIMDVNVIGYSNGGLVETREPIQAGGVIPPYLSSGPYDFRRQYPFRSAWIPIAIAMLFVIDILLIFDRFVTIHWNTTTSQPSASPSPSYPPLIHPNFP
jgi:hypothetical protein